MFPLDVIPRVAQHAWLSCHQNYRNHNGTPANKSVWSTLLRCITDQAQHRALCYDQKPRLVNRACLKST